MAGGAHLGGAASFGGSPLPKVAGMETDVNADINVTPMIDVMLVLLIIFMITVPSLAGYTAILPKAKTSAPEKEKRVTLGIDRQGNYYLEGKSTKKLTEQNMTDELKKAYASRPDDHILYLKADNQATYAKVLTAIDAARNAGVRRIGAITELPKRAPKE
jgi:biopolymer transport protein ExbD